jgi:hypothetical protein
MKTIKVQKALILVSIAAGVLAAGCELIVDFDRTKIPVENIDSGGMIDAASLGDGAVFDSGNNGDTGADAAGEEDASDAGGDAQEIKDAANDG